MYGISQGQMYSYDKLGIAAFCTVTAILTVFHIKRTRIKPYYWGLVQIIDLVVISLMVLSRNGIESECYNLYFLVVLQAGLVSGARQAIVCMFLSTVFYTGSVLITGLNDLEIRKLIVRVIVGWLAGVIGAYLIYWEKKYHKQALTDSVTSIYNRSYLEQSLKYELEKAKERRTLLSIIMIDIDNFKAINDSFGHRSGDLVLEQVADLIQANIRDVDFVARYGGEEFIVALPEIGPDRALEIAERIRNAIEQSSFIGANLASAISLTVSCGLAAYPVTAKNLDELMQKADEFMYEAKRAGRNQVYYKAG
jgi:diguanylate cyclase (GGDEF)-like protein